MRYVETWRIVESLEELLEATKELNGDYQSGWDKEIERAEQVIAYLKDEIKDSKKINKVSK